MIDHGRYRSVSVGLAQAHPNYYCYYYYYYTTILLIGATLSEPHIDRDNRSHTQNNSSYACIYVSVLHILKIYAKKFEFQIALCNFQFVYQFTNWAPNFELHNHTYTILKLHSYQNVHIFKIV